MANPFVQPNWWPGDITLDPEKCQNYSDAARYAHKRYKKKQEWIGKKLDKRVTTKRVNQLKPGDILEGSRVAVTGGVVGAGVMYTGAGAGAAAFGAEKGAELGLFGGPIGVAAGAAAGALIGFASYGIYRHATRPSIQVDMYTDGPADYVTDPSPNNLFHEVEQREIEGPTTPADNHELGKDAREWYYYARLGKYCHQQSRDLDDPYNHKLAAERAYAIATRCRSITDPFQWP